MPTITKQELIQNMLEALRQKPSLTKTELAILRKYSEVKHAAA